MDPKYEIKRLLSNNKSKEALNFIIDLYENSNDVLFNEAILIQSRFEHLQKSIRLNLISSDEFSRELSKINYSIIQILDDSNKGPKKFVESASLPKLLLTVLISTCLFAIYGLFGAILLMILINTFFASSIEFLASNGHAYILPMGIGLLVGQRLRYIYENRLGTGIFAIILGLAISFYFKSDSQLVVLAENILLKLLNAHFDSLTSLLLIKKANGFIIGLISTITLSAFIGGFTAIFREEYRRKLKLQISEFEKSQRLLSQKGFVVETSGLYNRILRFEAKLKKLESTNKSEADIKMYNRIIQWIKKVKKETDEDPNTTLVNSILRRNSLKVPRSPFLVYSENGTEVQKFSSLDGLKCFALGQHTKPLL